MTAEERSSLRALISRARQSQVNLVKKDRLQSAIKQRATKAARREARERAARLEVIRSVLTLEPPPRRRGELRCGWCGKRTNSRAGCPEHRDLSEACW